MSDGIYTEVHRSVDSVMAALRTRDENCETGRGCGWGANYSANWTHYKEWRDAEKAAEFGSEWHRNRSQELMRRIEAQVPDLMSYETDMVWDVAPGIGFDVARAIEGEPESWFDFREKFYDEVTIVIDGAFNCRTSTDRVERAGAAVCALVQVLQSRGIGVRVWRAFSVSSDRMDRNSGRAPRRGHWHCNIAVAVQQPDSPLDVDALAYWAGSTDAFRRQIFKLYDHLEGSKGRECRDALGSGLGYPQEARNAAEADTRFAEATQVLADGVLYLGIPHISAGDDFVSDEAAAAWLLRNVQQYTGDTGEEVDSGL